MSNPDSAGAPDPLAVLRGTPSVLLVGAGVSGLAVIEPLLELGASLTVADRSPSALGHAADFGAATVSLSAEGALPAAFDWGAVDLVVTSPGFAPHVPVLRDAAAHGVPIWGDIELTWRVDRAGLYGPARQWVVVTGTNGKTTTTSMLAAILSADGRAVAAAGNIGVPVMVALRREPRVDVLAIELSSFQLHWAPSVRPAAGAVLNLAEDHLDWHGSMDAYVQAKAGALRGDIAVVGADDPRTAALGAQVRADGTRVVGFRIGPPAPGEVGVRRPDHDPAAPGEIVDAAFAEPPLFLATTERISPPGPSGLADAAAAAALARAVGARPESIAEGLAAHEVGPHRGTVVADLGGVRFIDDSKATNPHAAVAAVSAHRRVVWIAGGQLKGASPDELVTQIAERLHAVVLLGVDAPALADALLRHAPNVPTRLVVTGDDEAMTADSLTPDGHRTVLPGSATPADVMREVVREAAEYAAPGDVVLLAPAAASLDMFTGMSARGDAFAAAVTELGESGWLPSRQ